MARIIKAVAYIVDYSDNPIDANLDLSYRQGDINNIDGEAYTHFYLQEESKQFEWDDALPINLSEVTPETFEDFMKNLK